MAAMDRATGIHGMELLSGRTNLRSHTSGDVDRDDSIRVGVRLRLHAEDVGPQLMPRHVRHRLNRKNVVGGDRPAACSPLRNQSRVNLEQARKRALPTHRIDGLLDRCHGLSRFVHSSNIAVLFTQVNSIAVRLAERLQIASLYA